MVPAPSTEQYLIVERIVEDVLGSTPARLDELVRRAASAGASSSSPGEGPGSAAGALVKHLGASPDDVGALEALVVLCLAHEKLERSLRFALIPQGRRLAALLRREGRVERAQEVLEALAQRAPRDRGLEKDLASVMRRTGNVDRLIERYLARAEEAEACGRRRDAITWLREVLMLDSSRRDVARMIRDLQYQTRLGLDQRNRRWRAIGLWGLLLALVSGVVFRELYIRDLYASIPPAAEDSRPSLEERMARLDRLIEKNPLWLGMFQAGRERAKLRGEIERLRAHEAQLEREQADLMAERQIMAESARVRARQLVENADYAGAAEQYRLALELAPEAWPHSARVQADLDAVLARMEQERTR